MTVRSKCVEELLNTEKAYVKMLKDIIQVGFVFILHFLHGEVLPELQAWSGLTSITGLVR